MYEPGAVVRSPRGTVVEVLENGPERLRIRRKMPPATGRAAPHKHLDGVETFTLLEGEATGAVDGQKRVLRPGDFLRVPVGSSHLHPRTASDATAVVEHTIEPRPRFAEVYFQLWLPCLEAGRVDAQEELGPLGVMWLVENGGGGTWVVGVPVAVQKLFARVLAPVASARGYGVAM